MLRQEKFGGMGKILHENILLYSRRYIHSALVYEFCSKNSSFEPSVVVLSTEFIVIHPVPPGHVINAHFGCVSILYDT